MWRITYKAVALWLCALTLSVPAAANESVAFSRVVDVGAGLCTLTAVNMGLPEGTIDDRIYLIVYDTGTGRRCSEAISKYVHPDIKKVDLLVVSHSDYDHYGGAAYILRDYEVKEIWHTGYLRENTSFGIFSEAVRQEFDQGALLRTMRLEPIVFGEKKPIRDGVFLEFFFGEGEWSWGNISSEAEMRNALSIVMKLNVWDHSMLFTGDTIGRRIDDPDYACKDSEAMMVANPESKKLRSTVMLAPHHGANNASSKCFIEAVSPTSVIFPAGHRHEHPRKSVYDRYIAAGVSPDQVYRTDLGDREEARAGASREWVAEGPTCKDAPGDDDILVYFYRDRAPLIGYFDDGGYEACGD